MNWRRIQKIQFKRIKVRAIYDVDLSSFLTLPTEGIDHNTCTDSILVLSRPASAVALSRTSDQDLLADLRLSIPFSLCLNYLSSSWELGNHYRAGFGRVTDTCLTLQSSSSVADGYRCGASTVRMRKARSRAVNGEGPRSMERQGYIIPVDQRADLPPKI